MKLSCINCGNRTFNVIERGNLDTVLKCTKCKHLINPGMCNTNGLIKRIERGGASNA